MTLKDPIKRAEYNREYAKKNREKIYKDHRVWIEANREKQAAYHKKYNQEWYKKNRDIRRKQLSEYQKNHKKDNVKRVQKYAKTANGNYRIYVLASKRRGHKFDLSLQEYLHIISKDCRYCGEKTEKVGIDRIDNSIGYTIENSASCCKKCNFMKRNYSVNDFLAHIKKIYMKNN